MNLQQIASQSVEGKAATARIQELSTKKKPELDGQEQGAPGGAAEARAERQSVLNDSARGQLEKDIDRMQREIQFAQQNSQAEVQDLTQDLQRTSRAG